MSLADAPTLSISHPQWSAVLVTLALASITAAVCAWVQDVPDKSVSPVASHPSPSHLAFQKVAAASVFFVLASIWYVCLCCWCRARALIVCAAWKSRFPWPRRR